ncbi:MAG: sensor histidine kinase [Dokdonella sp.]|jgi:signal transduction histidine kinase|uniref:sensor histidine kinase n=1 Tax=Dokdonella sp. TaxID=2291710 RepID=UPI001B5FD841|nr:sensor histidine kinase [Dokdonella sp.]MCC6441233.1 sensor histidine kinase [Rhodanobacteraceae bacterium]MBK8124572.1 sensor histidine kinase [Dokdonella sp.]MBP6325766.1 sensor histidine kinase [Dokdonella sp.]HNV07347.1 sensor histidine kinase [Dokdonella sp.]HQV48071.1 sensor histidine kinase [Dokdonella sp.]
MPASPFNHIQLLRYASLFTYACVGIPLLQYETVVAEMLEGNRPAYFYDLWLGCYLAFGLVFWFLTHDMGARNPSGLRRLVQILLLLVLNLLAIAVGWLSQSGLCALLLVVVSVALPWILNLQVGVAWMVLQNFSLLPLFASWPNYSLSQAIWQAAMYLGISTTTFVTSMIAWQQAEAREEQRRLNAELRATRALLAESSRLGERMRISRELHDLVGHHLTALSLNLEVASHLVSGQAQEHVRQAQSVARLLLSDVREVVSQLREDDSIDLTAALHALVEGVPGLQIHLDLPARFTVDDPRRAQLLLRCAQEIITNTVRHAGARNLWLAFERTSDRRLAIHARDDGHGSAQLKHGNGLSGMQERLSQFGGQLDIATAKDQGFTLDAWLPMEATQ